MGFGASGTGNFLGNSRKFPGLRGYMPTVGRRVGWEGVRIAGGMPESTGNGPLGPRQDPQKIS